MHINFLEEMHMIKTLIWWLFYIKKSNRCKSFLEGQLDVYMFYENQIQHSLFFFSFFLL